MLKTEDVYLSGKPVTEELPFIKMPAVYQLLFFMILKIVNPAGHYTSQAHQSA